MEDWKTQRTSYPGFSFGSISSLSMSVSASSKSCLHPFQSIHRGSIANLNEWLQHLPQPFGEEPEEEEIQEVPQQPETSEMFQDNEESGPSPRSVAEPVEPQPIQVPPDTEDFEYPTASPPQEPELHQEEPPRAPTPPEIVPPTPTPAVEEMRSPSPVLDSQLSPSIPFDPSPAPETPKFEEERDANVDIINISDDDGDDEEEEEEEEEAQSPDSYIDNTPRTPSPTVPITIDTTLLYRGPDRPTIVAPPSPIHDPQYDFDPEFSFDPINPPAKDDLPYHLPLLNSLPPEFRKKTTRTQRKREKERERTDVRKEKEEWTPMGMARWRALLRANPTWQHLAKSSKSLTTKDWNVSLFHILDLCRLSTSTRLH